MDPRYSEHLVGSHWSVMPSCLDLGMLGCNAPATQGSTRDERYIPHHIDRIHVQTDNNALGGQRDTARILDHDHTIPESKVLVLKSIDRMGWFEDSLARDSLNFGLLDRRG